MTRAARTGARRRWGRGRPRVGRSPRRCLALLPAAPVLAAAACVDVLGLDGYEDAIAKLCVCDKQVPTPPDKCLDRLSSRLSNASPATRRVWLEYFVAHCVHDCTNAYECYQQPPTCVGEGLSCVDSRECCGYADGGLMQCAQQECRVTSSAGDAGGAGGAA